MDLASTASSTGPMQDPASVSHQPNLHNPLPLSAAQEQQVKDIYYKRVRDRCAQEIKDFAVCATGLTVSAAWICRDQRLNMKSCMIAHATIAEEDAARVEWFSGRDERREKREKEAAALERRREEVFALTRMQEQKERAAKASRPKAMVKP